MVIDSLSSFYEKLECSDFVLSEADQEEFEGHIEAMLHHYRILHLEAKDAGQNRWHEVPKFHYLWHIGLQSRWSNPRWNWCYPDEDFMRILKAGGSLLISN